MAHRLRPETVDFLATALKRWAFDAPVAAPQPVVFDAISADPKTWSWFPGITGGGYRGDGPPGVGTIREARMGPTVYRETMIAWDAPSRWTYRVDEMTVPLAHALVEEWLVEEAGSGSVVRWTFAIDPRPLFLAGGPAVPRVMGSLFRRAMRNLAASLNGGET